MKDIKHRPHNERIQQHPKSSSDPVVSFVFVSAFVFMRWKPVPIWGTHVKNTRDAMDVIQQWRYVCQWSICFAFFNLYLVVVFWYDIHFETTNDTWQNYRECMTSNMHGILWYIVIKHMPMPSKEIYFRKMKKKLYNYIYVGSHDDCKFTGNSNKRGWILYHCNPEYKCM